MAIPCKRALTTNQGVRVALCLAIGIRRSRVSDSGSNGPSVRTYVQGGGTSPSRGRAGDNHKTCKHYAVAYGHVYHVCQTSTNNYNPLPVWICSGLQEQRRTLKVSSDGRLVHRHLLGIVRSSDGRHGSQRQQYPSHHRLGVNLEKTRSGVKWRLNRDAEDD